MISCKSVSTLLLSDQLRELRWWKRMEVRLHLAMCDICARLAQQLAQIRIGAHGLGDDGACDGIEERILQRLSEKNGS